MLTLAAMSSFDERRRARAEWPIRKIALGDEPLTDARDCSTVDERLALVRTLTMRCWAFSGRPVPTYTRANMPGRLVRRR
jgi:hypothetical protein